MTGSRGPSGALGDATEHADLSKPGAAQALSDAGGGAPTQGLDRDPARVLGDADLVQPAPARASGQGTGSAQVSTAATVGSTCADPSKSDRRAALREASTVLVSACLLGEACRYDGRSQRSERVLAALEGKAVVPVCPEVGSGLPIPRPPVDLCGGSGVDVWAGQARALEREARVDRTEDFKRGATLALEAARNFGASVALLKEKSPSCGSQRVYESGVLRPGEGITTALLRSEDITVISDEEL